MTYHDARDAFRAAAAQSGAALAAIPCDDDPTLTVEVARLGPDLEAARAVVLVTSGLHGVEGPFGSAVQIGWLRSARGPLPPGVAVVLVHALTPAAYVAGRRFDAENIDPNRNFLPPGAAYAGGPPLYAQLDPLLNPRTPPPRFDAFLPRALLALARHGWLPVKQAVAGGQHDHPRGLFFAGKGPGSTHRLVAAAIDGWIGPAARIVHLDYHTGLGPRGRLALLLEPETPPDRVGMLRHHFGAGRVHWQPPRWAYTLAGSLGGWCLARFPDRPYDFFTAEFGTEPSLATVAALRNENRAHWWADPQSPAYHRAKARLREAFVPSSPRWRNRCVSAGMNLIDEAIASARDAG
jgi:hypothetical protein